MVVLAVLVLLVLAVFVLVMVGVVVVVADLSVFKVDAVVLMEYSCGFR